MPRVSFLDIEASSCRFRISRRWHGRSAAAPSGRAPPFLARPADGPLRSLGLPRVGAAVARFAPAAFLPARSRRLCVAQRKTAAAPPPARRSEEHTSELQSQSNLVCRLLLDKYNFWPLAMAALGIRGSSIRHLSMLEPYRSVIIGPPLRLLRLILR